MENHLTPYQSVITEIKSIISSGQEEPIVRPVRQCCLPIGILANEL